MNDATVKPRMPIRRFDVFTEYQRLKAHEQGMDHAHAEGYGLWVAKVVASGRGRRTSMQHEPSGEPAESPERQKATAEQEWHVLGDEPQTDALFQRDVVQRMGQDFYRHVFEPAIAEAFRQGKRYESIRDTIRKGWTPKR